MNVANEIILASAGSGKTYRLSNRIVKLLAEDVPPAEILALTFTRKAAGEFARRTLTKLADAASDPAFAKSFAGELSLDAGKSDTAFFGELLSKTVHSLHRLRLGTLDSFYQSLVRTHFFELGLSGTFTLLDERLAESERLRVVSKIFRRDAGKEDDFSEFLEAFKLATFGNEERGVSKLMNDFIRNAFSLYQLFNDNDIWGNPEKLWSKTGCPWLPTPGDEELAGALAELRDFSGKTNFGDKRIAGAISKFVEVSAAWQPGVPLTALGSFFETKILPDAHEFIRAGNAGVKISYYKKEVEFSPPVTHAVAIILRRVIGESLLRRVRMTAGVCALLRQYDTVYDASVRRAGKLTFADMPALLSRAELTSTDIGLRLDATVKHWLFDEFQDTSRNDWSVVANNVDEVLNDTTGERSAFFVGDVKQALYGWRGGAYALLPEIRDQYALPETELHATYRSCPEVVAMVNAVFDNLAGVGDTLPATALGNWKKVWHSHESAGEAKKISGYAAWCVCEKSGDADENKMRRLDVVAGLLAQARFLEKNLTCGLLTQTNDETREAAEFLRERGVRVVSETDTAIAGDSPFILALLATIEFSAHPENGYAGGTLAMLPALSAWRDALGGDEAMRLRVLSSIAGDGFEKTFRDIANLGSGHSCLLSCDAFLKKRLEQLFALAREFDDSGSRVIDDFLRFARNSTRREIAAGNCVQVMTVHKAKGLEFDVVFLPFLEGDRLDSARKESFIKSENAGNPWILSTPETAICELTPTLAENLASRKSEACYENLCKLYVALTRAKSATYVITTDAGDKDFSGANFPRLLDATLGNKTEPGFSDSNVVAWECGKRDWFADRENVSDKAEEPSSARPGDSGDSGSDSQSSSLQFRPAMKRRALRRPSEGAKYEVSPADIFSNSGGGAEFGSCVHALLATVPFVDSGNAGEVSERINSEAELLLKNGYKPELIRSASATAKACVSAPALREVFVSPGQGAELWRERAFDVVLDGERASGVFDRVVVAGDRVNVFDFKTDAGVSPAELSERYAGQLNLYRRAAAKLCGVPECRVHVALVHLPTLSCG